MNPKGLKVGDKVLIKAELLEVFKDGRISFNTRWSIDNLGDVSEVYSLAPQFAPGEMIEVQYEGSKDWKCAIFAGYVLGDRPYKATLGTDPDNPPGWKHARKIQSEKKPTTLYGKDIDVENFRVETNGKTFKLVEVEL